MVPKDYIELNNVFSAVLNCEPYEMPRNAEGLAIDSDRLNNLLCRLVRRHMTVPETGHTNTFRISRTDINVRTEVYIW